MPRAAVMDAWFADAASFLQVDLDRSLEELFGVRGRDRPFDESQVDDPRCNRVAYLDGPETCSIHRYYNNRRAMIARYLALVGVHQDDAALRSSARRFVEEFLAYGVFPGGRSATSSGGRGRTPTSVGPTPRTPWDLRS
jgi:hypothetical protein